MKAHASSDPQPSSNQLPSSLAQNFAKHWKNAQNRFVSKTVILGDPPDDLPTDLNSYTFQDLVVAVFSHLENTGFYHTNRLSDLGFTLTESHDWRYNSAVKAIAYHEEGLFQCARIKVRGQATDSMNKANHRRELHEQNEETIYNNIHFRPHCLPPDQALMLLEDLNCRESL